MTLAEILEFGKAHKACAAQYSKFKFFIESGDDLQAWQTVLGNIVWLKKRGLEIELSDVLQITNIAKTWNVNGQLYNRYTYNKEGEIDGLYESWDSNGKLRERYTYKNNYRNGLYELWHPSGLICERYTYKNNCRDGLYESWHENGQLCERCTYNAGKLEGLYEIWYWNGQLYKCYTYKNGGLIKELQ